MPWPGSCIQREHAIFLHYLDNLLFFGRPGTDELQGVAAVVMSTFTDLGIPVATHKTEGLAACVTFLGIQIDTMAGQLRLPDDKLTRLTQTVELWQTKRACTRRELESLLGNLSYAASVVRPGRVFLRSLFTLLSRRRRPHLFVRLNSAARADLHWWHAFLQLWNGVSFFPRAPPLAAVFSDASGSYGCGGFETSLGWFQLPGLLVGQLSISP